MKKTLTILMLLCMKTFFTTAQLVPCRPRVAMIYYWYHNDTATNTAMSTIINFKPDILIDNTPGGLWHGACLPLKYKLYGTKVYSYITGGYEGHTRGGDTSQLAANLLRIDAIAADSAEGVFLDEVTYNPDSTRKAYIAAIYNRCKAKGLKLIINTGVPSFDTSLMRICDYILTDEHYSSMRKPTLEESLFGNRVIVVSTGITSATDAANNSLRARDYGFGYSYSCYEYISFPSWLATYNTYISNMTTATPHIYRDSKVIVSSASVGNQWYNSLGILAGETNDTLVPTVTGDYYSIVTLDNCVSDSSNVVTFIVPSTGVEKINDAIIEMHPVPATDFVWFKTSSPNMKQLEIKIYTMTGSLVRQETITTAQPLSIKDLSNGVYIVTISGKDINLTKRLIVQQ